MRMKLLVAALALISGTVFAQAPTAPAKAAADTPAATTTTTETTTKVEKTTTHKKMAKHKMAAKKTTAKKTMSAKKTQSMGAGADMMLTDLNAPARQSRMDQAYSNWQAGKR